MGISIESDHVEWYDGGLGGGSLLWWDTTLYRWMWCGGACWVYVLVPGGRQVVAGVKGVLLTTRVVGVGRRRGGYSAGGVTVLSTVVRSKVAPHIE